MNYYRKTKKGFTLIELLAAISLITLILNWGIWGTNNYRECTYNYELDYVNNSILSLLDNAKQYCRKNSINGMVCFDCEKNSISFYSQNKTIKVFKFPQNFKLTFIDIHDTNSPLLYFNSNGFTSDACTISFKDPHGGVHTISLSVGTAFVEIHE